MNYLVAVDKFHLDLYGGAYKIAWDVACAMKGEGHHVALLCIGDGEKPACEICQGIRIVRYVPEKSLTLIGKAKSHIASASAAAKKYLGDVRWDVIHGHTIFPALGAYQAFGGTTRTVFTIHSPTVMEQRINWSGHGVANWLKRTFGMKMLAHYEAALYQKYETLHCLSQYTRSQIQRLYGVGEKISVIPYWSTFAGGRDYDKAQARKKLGWLENKPLIFSLRRLCPRMGLEDAVAAAGNLANSHDFTMVLAGGGPLKEQLERQSRSLGLEHKVFFPGRLADEQVALAYQAADLFILPTQSLECFGIIILEAYSFGCPVLGSDTGAIPELVGPIDSNLIYPAGDVAALTEKLRAVFDGRLPLPAPEKLIHFIRENYSQAEIYPRWRKMIAGDR
jgi:glycosyltransferase involved in cell wall biosynthesis